MKMGHEQEPIRINIRVQPHIKEWFEEKSKRTAIPYSALMHLALEEHINRQEQQDLIPQLPEIMETIKKANENNE